MGGEKVELIETINIQKNTQELEFKWKQTSEQVVQQFVSAIADL